MKLNELQTPHRLIAARQAAGLTQYETAVDEMRDCVRRIGYKVSFIVFEVAPSRN